MELILNPVMERLIEQNIRTGGYATAEDVVQAALFALSQQRDLGDFAPGELDKLLAEGEASLEAEGTLDGDEAFLARRARRVASGREP